MNQDLENERSNCTFDIERMTYMLDDGMYRTKRRRELESIIERDPTGVFDNTMNHYLHRTERYVRSLAKQVRLLEICRQLHIGDYQYNGHILQDPDYFTLLQAISDDLPTSLHWVMFVPNLISLFTEQQLQYWLPLIRDWKVIGCYAQTELGHGSNVRGLETTATFVPGNIDDTKHDNDGYFVIHSPTVTSTKFWPGTLGRTANHAIVIARLIDGNGKDCGIHNFIVPLRSMIDHKLLPGVTTGDIGPKIGYNTMDNGFATFTHVKIPRHYMAMKFAYVDPQGQYHKIQTANAEAASKIVYITMMQVRAYIVNEASKHLALACTIVLRYSIVRKQGYNIDNSSNLVENKILDYKQQQYRLIPLLASSYCFYFTGKLLLQQLQHLEKSFMDQHKSAITKYDVTDIHATSSALKSYTTMITADGIEECRKACGGHGFLACSGLSELYTTYLQNPTVEGDNHMLPQQVIKVLLKLVSHIVVGNDTTPYQNCNSYHLIPSLQYLIQYEMDPVNTKKATCPAQSQEDMLDVTNVLLPAFRHRAARILFHIAKQLQYYTTKKNCTQAVAWNYCLIDMFRCSKAYSQFLILMNSIHGIEEEFNKGTTIGINEKNVLYDLIQLFGMICIEQNLGEFLEDGYLLTNQVSYIRDNILYLLDKIRPNCIGLIDARDFSDFKLKSTIGRYHGNVYEAILQSAKNDPLNSTEPGPGYNEHLKRIIVDGVGQYHNNDKDRHCMNSGTISRL